MDKDLKIERQKFQMHKNGYNDIVKAIQSIPKTEVNIPETKIDMTDTNEILLKLVDKINEPICVKLDLI